MLLSFFSLSLYSLFLPDCLRGVPEKRQHTFTRKRLCACLSFTLKKTKQKLIYREISAILSVSSFLFACVYASLHFVLSSLSRPLCQSSFICTYWEKSSWHSLLAKLFFPPIPRPPFTQSFHFDKRNTVYIISILSAQPCRLFASGNRKKTRKKTKKKETMRVVSHLFMSHLNVCHDLVLKENPP